MTRLLRVSCAVGVLIGVLSWAVPARADLSNGDFEAGQAPWVLEPDAAIEGGMAILLEGEDYDNSDSLGSYNVTSVSQTFSEAAGPAQLAFDFRLLSDDEGGTGPETDYFDVLLNGVAVYSTSTDDADIFNAQDVQQAVVPVPLLASNDLEFRLKGYLDDYVTVVELDNVRIAPIPAPGAVFLGILGLGAAGARLRRTIQ